jgi:L-2-hydroxyglutarate oxidase LhgO
MWPPQRFARHTGARRRPQGAAAAGADEVGDRFECVVVGAGVVGLAVARGLAQAGREVLVLEAAATHGAGISARNSEVIHAGLYYSPSSLKARLCVAGRRALYAFCAARGVATMACGKLVVATAADEEPLLADLAARAAQNGVEGLRLLSGAEARALEPSLHCTAALLSPATGILDSHAYMLALRGDAEAAGAVFAFRAPATEIVCESDGFAVRTGGEAPALVWCDRLVNAAGLGAVALAHATIGLAPERVPPSYLSKGSYFTLAGRTPFRHLIYPLPIQGGAGIHLTLDLAGQARFGPDVEAVDTIDFAVDPRRAEGFYGAIRRYWPGLPDGALVPGYAGIRPKIVPADQMTDFVIQGPLVHSVPGLVNLFGIESPGLTASLAIADEAVALLG